MDFQRTPCRAALGWRVEASSQSRRKVVCRWASKKRARRGEGRMKREQMVYERMLLQSPQVLKES